MRLTKTNWVKVGVNVIGLILVTLGVMGCDSAPPTRAVPTFAPRPTSTPMPPVAKGSAAKVMRGTIDQSVSARGSIASARQSFLFFNVSGALSKVSVAAGDQVKQGAAIGQLDTFQIEQDLNAAKYEADRTDVLLRQSQTKLASYDLQIETDNYLLARNTELRDQLWQLYRLKAPTPADHARAINEYQSYLNADTEVRKYTKELNTLKTDKQITALDVDLYQKTLLYQQKRVESLQGRLASAQLVAPINGLILSLDKRLGDTVQAYESIGAIADPTQLQVEVSVSETDIAAVSLGQTARIVLDGFPDRNFTGKVKEIASKASIFQGKSIYRVVIVFDNPAQVPATLRMGADVSLVRQAKDNVLLVPSKAILQEGATQFVSVLRGDKWERVEVRVGVSGGSQSEILSGLSEGDQVLVP